MSDSEEIDKDEVKEEPQPEDTFIVGSAPMGFVKGGTGTTASENLYEQRYQEAEQRRDQAERDRAMGQAPASPDQASGLMTNQFTAHPEIPKAFILLKYVDRFGQEIVINGEPVACCADLIVGLDPLMPTELSIVLVCPRCQQQSHKHQQDNQLVVRQSNKNFEFVAGKGPRDFVFQGQRFKSAGMITQSEPFSCDHCGWRARIDNNRVWPD
jgi:hypothetical protein